ncbi:MAG: SocA family protein [Gemmatimonadota bacterium]|jgi:uncharacterized phage-associated protein|nr:SocA family protein [Gemmatimonadota bacterium]
MNLRYHQERATQAAARLLEVRGGVMSYLKLLKLLYLADRRSLLQHGRPITFDRFVSMDHGPVLSQTYNLIVGEEQPGQRSYWREHITEPEHHEVRLLKKPTENELSAAQERILDEVFDEFGRMGRWQLVDYVHTLAEWQDPHGSSIPISIRDVLRAGGLDDEVAEAVENDLAGEDALSRLLQ